MADNNVDRVEILYLYLDRIVPVLSNPRNKAILKEVVKERRKGITRGEVQVKTRISTGSTHHHLKIITDVGLITGDDSWPVRYKPARQTCNMIKSLELLGQ